MACGSGAIGDIGDAPLAVEALAVGAAVAGAARVVDVEHGKATARIELHARLQARVRHARGPAMRQHQGRRGGTLRSAMVRVHRRVVDAVHRLPLRVLEREHLATADESGLDEIRRPFCDRMHAAPRKPHDGRRPDRRAHQRGEAVADGQRVVDARGFSLQPAGSNGASAGELADVQVRHAARRRNGSEAPVGMQRITARAEHPLRPPKLGAGGTMHASNSGTVPAIEMPPTGLVPGEIKVTVGAPFRLKHRAAIAAGDTLRPLEKAVLAHVRHVQRGAVPRHVRQIPGEERQPAAVGR